MTIACTGGSVAETVGVRARRTTAWLPRAAGSVALLLAAATVALHVVNGGYAVTSWWFGTTTIAISSGAMGWLLARRCPANSIGWLFCAAGVAAGLCGVGREYLVLSLTGHPLPAADWIGLGGADTLFVVSIAVLPAVLMIFPEGRPLPGRVWRIALIAVPVCATFAWLGVLFSPDEAFVAGRVAANPLGTVFPSPAVSAYNGVNSLTFPLLAVAAIVSLVLRYRRSGADTRRQVIWVMLAGSISLVETALELTPLYSIGTVVGPITDALFIAAIAVAIVRHQLLDIDLVVNRTLVYVAVSLLLIAGYLGVVTVVAHVVPESGAGGPLLGTAMVAVAFAPLRSRMQHGIDRLMYGDRRDPYRVMTSLNRQLERTDAPGAEFGIVLDVVTGSLKLPYAAIRAADGTLLAETGRPRGPVAGRPLSYRGESVGTLLVCPRTPGSALGAVDQRLLDDLARQAAVLLHAVALAADLQESRRRMVTAKEEERRRLRRDLHDGLGPELAALTLKVDGAALQLAHRPERATELLRDVRIGLGRTIDDIHRLVSDLRPPALDELGLLGALRDFVRRLETADSSRPVFCVEAPEEWPTLPAAVEVAAYRIATEAMTNVVRHAEASRCQVRLGCEHGALTVAVVDDGRGLPDTPVPGVGTRSIVERASEIGGTATVRRRTDAPGTVVLACLPLTVDERTPA
jgi:signal transduction histidine kinase